MVGITVRTIGHGTLPADEFLALVGGADIDAIVDIRSFPGSRRNPQYARQEMARWVPEGDIAYRWVRDLGGRRRPVPGSKHVALRHEAFRAYADYMETAEFRSGVAELLALAGGSPTAVMCSESVWWRCHRRLLADHLMLVEGIDVVHLMHDGRQTPHAPTEGVRVTNGGLVYDVGTTPELSPD